MTRVGTAISPRRDGHERGRLQRSPQLGQEPLGRGRNRLQAGGGRKRACQRRVGRLATGAHLERHATEELAPLAPFAQADPLRHARRHGRVQPRLGGRRGEDQAGHEVRMVDRQPQRDPAATRLGFDGHRSAGRAWCRDRRSDRRGAGPRMKQHVRIGGVIRNRPTHDHHAARRAPGLPAALEQRLGARQEPQPGLHAPHDQERGARPAGQAQPFDPAARNGQRLDPARLRHRSILAC